MVQCFEFVKGELREFQITLERYPCNLNKQKFLLRLVLAKFALVAEKFEKMSQNETTKLFSVSRAMV